MGGIRNHPTDTTKGNILVFRWHGNFSVFTPGGAKKVSTSLVNRPDPRLRKKGTPGAPGFFGK